MPILQSPSNTESAPYLDNDSLYHIMSKVVEMSPIHNAIVLRSVNWQICKAVNYALYLCPEISIELKWHEDRQTNPEPRIFIQGSEIASFEKALKCLDFLLSHARCIKTLVLNIEVSNVACIEKLLLKFLDAGRIFRVECDVTFSENVKLEVLKIRRRYVGQSYPIIADLIYQHSKTLKIVGKIGLSEAVDSFNDRVISKSSRPPTYFSSISNAYP